MTGPNVVFEEALFAFCKDNDLNFMATRVWVGFWILIISVLFSMFELSWLISKFSRFTEEIFSILISLIFIIETFKKLGKVNKQKITKKYIATIFRKILHIFGQFRKMAKNLEKYVQPVSPNCYV